MRESIPLHGFLLTRAEGEGKQDEWLKMQYDAFFLSSFPQQVDAPRECHCNVTAQRRDARVISHPARARARSATMYGE